jgi:hypothetical protein
MTGCSKDSQESLTITREQSTSITARYTHQNCVRVVTPEDGQVMPETCEALSFNKVKVNVKCIKLVRVIKLYHDARSTKH